jgi:aminopeptidase N
MKIFRLASSLRCEVLTPTPVAKTNRRSFDSLRSLRTRRGWGTRYSWAGTIILLLFAACLASAQRLPQAVQPLSYSLTITPDLKAATFSGVESIDITLDEASPSITLNAAEIAFQNVTVIAGNMRQQATVSLDPLKEQATLTFPHKLPAGKATLNIAYTGILNNELRGFYLSRTAQRNYAVTQFEPTDARRAFPCFDEPAFKATFDVALVLDAGDTAISNSPIKTDTPGDLDGKGASKHTIHFATTPKMSSYLLAFLVGDFQCSSGESDGVAIRVCSTPDKVALTPYGVDVAKWVLHYYNGYFGIPYPLKKLDLIALPDFEAGAMENFGAITYRETDLLLDEKTASVHSKREVALVIAHEMAHQWFGDLVTMQWWDNLWLNEGFATWMENKAVAQMHPEWHMDRTVAGDLDNTLNLDAQSTTRSIRAKADTPDEINQMFDGITYQKAGAVLSTVENYLGEETFRQGVHNYLTAHAYANATAEDFWGAQTTVSHKPVDKIMESLVAQPGEPILIFGQPSNGKVSVTQKRFFASPGPSPYPAQKWTLPVCFKTVAGQDCQILTPSESRLNVPADGIFYANAGDNGYYRSAYAPSTYAALLAHVESALAPTERISLLGDRWALMLANQASVGDYLDLVTAVKADPSAEVVGSAFAGIGSIFSGMATSPEEKAQLAAWIRAAFAPEYVRLAPPSAADSDNTRERRSVLFSLLGFYGNDPAVLAQARQIALQFLADPASVDATLGQTSLTLTASHGDAHLFDQLQKIYETSAYPEMQQNALRAMIQFEDPTLVERALDYAVSGKVRNQDVGRQLSHAFENDRNRDQVWKFIETHWDKVQAQLTASSGSRLTEATGYFCSAQDRDEVKNFFSTHTVAASDRSLKHAVEHIDGCIQLRSLQEPKLRQWLAAQPKSQQ